MWRILLLSFVTLALIACTSGSGAPRGASVARPPLATPISTAAGPPAPGTLIVRGGTDAHAGALWLARPGGAASEVPGSQGYFDLAAWSPSGAQLAVTAERAAFPQTDPHIVLLSVDGSAAVDLGPGVPVSWSPDGAHLLFGYFGESYGEFWVVRADGGDRHRVVPACGPCSTPRWTPDGQRLLAQLPTDGGRGDKGTALAFIALDGSIVSALPPAAHGWADVALSPDGRSIAYTTNAYVDPAGGVHPDAIYTMAADGSGLREVQRGSSMRWPAWSSDSRRLAYVVTDTVPSSPPATSMASSLIVATPATGDASVLDTASWIGDVAWAPSGDRVVYTAYRGTGQAPQSHIYVVAASGGRPLDAAPGREGRRPLWSPDGTRIAFSPVLPAPPSVYAFDPAARTIRSLPSAPAGLRGACSVPPRSPGAGALACLSPDGRLSASVSPDGVLSVDEVATGANRWTSPAAMHVEQQPPAWSPDATRIAFLAADQGRTWIFTVPAGGGQPQRLVEADARGILRPTIAWSPDGGTLYFSRGGACAGGCLGGYLYRADADGQNARRVAEVRLDEILGFVP